MNPQMYRCKKIQHPRELGGDLSPNTELSMSLSFSPPQQLACVGSCVWLGDGREAPVRTEPRPTALNLTLCPGAILLVVVVVLVLDLLGLHGGSFAWGHAVSIERPGSPGSGETPPPKPFFASTAPVHVRLPILCVRLTFAQVLRSDLLQ
jgi:hypothetical protein